MSKAKHSLLLLAIVCAWVALGSFLKWNELIVQPEYWALYGALWGVALTVIYIRLEQNMTEEPDFVGLLIERSRVLEQQRCQLIEQCEKLRDERNAARVQYVLRVRQLETLLRSVVGGNIQGELHERIIEALEQQR